MSPPDDVTREEAELKILLLKDHERVNVESDVSQLRSVLIKKIDDVGSHDPSPNKITVVGCGQVGMAVAFSCLVQGVTSELCIVDSDKNKLHGEVLDMQHGSLFMKGAKVIEAEDYNDTRGSKICIVTAGARQKEGETRLQLISRNVDIFKDIIPKLVKHSPDTILLIVTNPVDILTWMSWKISGLPKSRVIGSGTNLDSSRFRYLISKRLHINVGNTHGWIIGEHGDSSVPVWSGVNVAGVRLQTLQPAIGTANDPEKWSEAHKKTINSAYEIIKLKGYTSWAIGLSAAQLADSILRHSNSIHPVSTLIQGLHGVKEEIFCSLPCVLGGDGIVSIVQLTLDPQEEKLFQESANRIYSVQKDIKI